MKIDYDIVRRYISDKTGSVGDEYMQGVQRELEEIAAVQKRSWIFDCTKGDFYRIEDLGLTIESRDVNDLFDECEKIAVFVVTLGLQVDKKIAYYGNADVLRSVVLDAMASVMVESVLDELQSQVDETIGLNPTMRYSPGYGDLALSFQRKLLTALGCGKSMGVMLNSSDIMIPQKSITALVGYSKKKQVYASVCLKCPNNGKCKVKCSRAQ